ncbi:hypothetical protein ABIB75_008073 [Bradyrhizobium sp. GM2.2]
MDPVMLNGWRRRMYLVTIDVTKYQLHAVETLG